MEWRKIAFPKEKANIELFIAQRFALTYNSAPLFSGLTITDLRQNAQNSLDFRVETSLGPKWLELMAIRPLEFFKVPPERAPSEHNPYNIGKFLQGKIMEKSRKYRAQRPSNIFLLLYVDDWRFQISKTTITLLQYWCNRKQHSFDLIFYYSPINDDSVDISIIAPTPSEYWRNFDPDLYRENKVINLDPSKWRLWERLTKVP